MADKAVKALKETKLLFEVPSNKVPLIYHSCYDITFLGLEKLHVFDSTKWGKIVKLLISRNLLKSENLVQPNEATNDDLLLAHEQSYLDSLKSSLVVAAVTELLPLGLLPNFLLQRNLLKPFRFQVGGTVLGARLALDRGWAINIGGGFHHCSSLSGGGFCAYADISLAAKFALNCWGIERVMIIDLDAHQGNGHEADFINDDRVYIFDMYNVEIYPQDHEVKGAIRRTVELKCGTSTESYIRHLTTNLEEMKLDSSFIPQLIIYNAGTDILEGDPLGLLKVDEDGVKTRDSLVFQFGRDLGCPVLMLTSGGYQSSNARVIADSIQNLASLKLISLS